MRAITYSWIGVSAAAPFIFLMCAWVLGVFHSYRRHWRSVDLFLLAVFVQELIMALQVFVYALLSLMRPESSTACGVFVWSMSATRTLQAATVTSLLVDRALTSQWPYKYRFSVRRHQIRYHLAVIATMAALVGVAAILAGDVPVLFEQCTFLPFDLHVRFALFLLSVYGLLIVVSVASIAVVQSTRGCSTTSAGSDSPDLSPITHGTNSSSSSSGRVLSGRPLHTAASSASTTSSNASSGRLGGMQAASSTTDLVPPPPPLRPPLMGGRSAKSSTGISNGIPSTGDFRWATSLSVSGLCFLTNHLPYLALTVVGTFLPSYMPSWPADNVALWLSLAEGLLLPLVLGLTDCTFSKAAGSSCVRETRRLPQRYQDGEGPFRLFPRDEVKSFPLTNGSLFSSLLNMNVDSPQVILPSYKRGHHGGVPGLRLGVGQEIRGLVGAVSRRHHPQDPYGSQGYYTSDHTASTASTTTSQDHYGSQGYYMRGTTASTVSTTTSQDPIYCDPLAKASSNNESLKLAEEDHIYATLSETFGSLSSFNDDFLVDHQRCSSVTTVANDDFEFHDPRADRMRKLEDLPYHSYQQSQCQSNSVSVRPPADLPRFPAASPDPQSSTSASPVSSFRSSSSDESSIEDIHRKNVINKRDPRDDLSSLHVYKSNSKETSKYVLRQAREEILEDLIEEQADKMSDILTDYKSDISSSGTLSRKHRSSSLSMNDLDRLEGSETQSEEQMMFILPMKSESMLSLYKLYLAEDEENGGKRFHYSFEISKSEGDLSLAASNMDNNEAKVGPPGSSLVGGKSEGSLHEVYQKRKPSSETGGSRIRRQHKIQRAKVVQQRARGNSSQHSSSNLSDSGVSLNSPSSGIVNVQRASMTSISEGLQVAVMDKSRRRNGIITIQDPSVLSVEELFKVLNRASHTTTKEGSKQNASTELPENTQHTTDYKKIFVSEYL